MRTHFVMIGIAFLSVTNGCTKPNAPASTGTPAPKALPADPEMIEGQSAPRVMHRQFAGDPDADGWYPAVSTQGGFSVRLPERFHDFTLPMTRGPIYVIGAVRPNGMRFTATASQPPDLRDVVDQMYMRADNSEPSGRAKRLKVDELEGVEFRDAQPGVSAGAVRFLHSNTTTYTLVVECVQGPKLPPGAELPADVERDAAVFFESFRLK